MVECFTPVALSALITPGAYAKNVQDKHSTAQRVGTPQPVREGIQMLMVHGATMTTKCSAASTRDPTLWACKPNSQAKRPYASWPISASSWEKQPPTITQAQDEANSTACTQHAYHKTHTKHLPSRQRLTPWQGHSPCPPHPC